MSQSLVYLPQPYHRRCGLTTAPVLVLGCFYHCAFGFAILDSGSSRDRHGFPFALPACVPIRQDYETLPLCLRDAWSSRGKLTEAPG